MKPVLSFVAGLVLTSLLVVDLTLNAADTVRGVAQPDLSFRNEVQLAIDRGLAWVKANQNSNG